MDTAGLLSDWPWCLWRSEETREAYVWGASMALALVDKSLVGPMLSALAGDLIDVYGEEDERMPESGRAEALCRLGKVYAKITAQEKLLSTRPE